MKIFGIGLGLVFAALAVFMVVSYISVYNFCNTSENNIKAAYTNNQTILSTYTQKVMTIAQVPNLQANNLSKVVTAAMQGRYGANGSQATWQWIKEQNPQLDQSIYTKLAQVIESGRDDFQNNQTHLIDLKRQYSTSLGSFWTGTVARMAGYPKINLDDYKVVTDDHTQESFQTGREQTLQLPKN